MTAIALEDVIGAKYRLRCLKPLAVRWSRTLKRMQFDARSLNPLAWLVEADDGRKFKLLRADEANRYRIELMMFSYEAASVLEFVPRVVWHDPHNILLEYIEGETPDDTSTDFARAFARCLAKIHNVDVGTLSAQSVRYGVERDLAEVVAGGLLDERAAERLRARLEALMPETIRTSLVYADLQASNFCFSPEGKLFLFDLGGFQRGRITDEYFFGHPLSRRLHLDAFKESYFAAGGMAGLFEMGDVVRLSNDIRMAAFFTRLVRNAPKLQVRKRRAFRVQRDDLTARLRAVI